MTHPGFSMGPRETRDTTASSFNGGAWLSRPEDPLGEEPSARCEPDILDSGRPFAIGTAGLPHPEGANTTATAIAAPITRRLMVAVRYVFTVVSPIRVVGRLRHRDECSPGLLACLAAPTQRPLRWALEARRVPHSEVRPSLSGDSFDTGCGGVRPATSFHLPFSRLKSIGTCVVGTSVCSDIA